MGGEGKGLNALQIGVFRLWCIIFTIFNLTDTDFPQTPHAIKTQTWINGVEEKRSQYRYYPLSPGATPKPPCSASSLSPATWAPSIPSAKATTDTKGVCLEDGLLDCSQMSATDTKKPGFPWQHSASRNPPASHSRERQAHLDPGEVSSHEEAEKATPLMRR